ncbi:MAG: HAD-IA family hydrolase [Proteobacteria bacterium]|nr:HAD-IA family hydrolase [Pseudomonadota bacterium]
MNIKGIVFDLDGTLIDSSKAILDSLFTATEYYNIKTAVKKDESYLFMGKSLTETLKIMIPDADHETIHKVGKYYVKHYYEFCVKDAKLFPGVMETIKTLYDKDIKLAVATAKRSDCAQAELIATGASEYFSVIRGTDEGVISKPNPQMLLEICANFKLKPENVLMVGDTDRDVIFGKNAGCHTCVVSHGNWTKERFVRENIIPDFFLDRFEDLQVI